MKITTTTLGRAGGKSSAAASPPKRARPATRKQIDSDGSSSDGMSAFVSKLSKQPRTYGSNKSKNQQIKQSLMPSKKKKKMFDVLSDDETPSSQASVGSLGVSKLEVNSDDEFQSIDTYLLSSAKRTKKAFKKPLKKATITSDSDVQIIEEEATIDLISTADLLSKAMAEKKTLVDPLDVICPHCDKLVRIKPTDPPRLYDAWTLFERTKKSHDSYSLGYAFHKIHDSFEKIVPDGIKNGYPQTIDFEALKQRVDAVFVEIKEIVVEKRKSHFRDLAAQRYSKLGRKAHGNQNKIEHINQIRAGYYGHKGEVIILARLQELIENEAGLITSERLNGLESYEFIQDVLVPETACLLIQQDMKTGLEEARKIMQESADYGAAVFGE